MRKWDELECEILKVPVFVGRVFFILIQNLDLQSAMCCIRQKEINQLYGSCNALWDTELIIDSVYFLMEKSTHFINWICLKSGPVIIIF